MRQFQLVVFPHNLHISNPRYRPTVLQSLSRNGQKILKSYYNCTRRKDILYWSCREINSTAGIPTTIVHCSTSISHPKSAPMRLAYPCTRSQIYLAIHPWMSQQSTLVSLITENTHPRMCFQGQYERHL